MQGHYQRLSALDATFLDVESGNAPMHLGAVMIFDAKPLTLEHGGLDFDRIVHYIEHSLHQVPRYRQRLEWVPALKYPVWVDDDSFNIRYHVRHSRLPLPADEAKLKSLAGRLFSQRLDRSKPLWEFWVIEGLEGDRFALVPKVHHCMMDGIAGLEIIQALLRITPDASVQEQEPWQARPAPSLMELLGAELKHRVKGVQELPNYVERFSENIESLATMALQGLTPSAKTEFNRRDVSPYRRFDYTSFDLENVKRIKKEFGGTINDVIVAVTTGAVRRFLERAGTDVDMISDFRAVLPVNTRAYEKSSIGNHVAMLLADLPVDEPDPMRRMQRVIKLMKKLKANSGQIQGAELVEEFADITTKALLSQLFKTATRVRTYNFILTNIPGPPLPLFLLGSELQDIYPLVQLMPNQNIGIALFSYAGKLNWGFNADWQSFPEVSDFVADIDASFVELAGLITERVPSAKAQPSVAAVRAKPIGS